VAGLVQEIGVKGLIVEVLINAAGLGANSRFDLTDLLRLSEMLEVTVVALTELTRLTMPGMLSRRKGPGLCWWHPLRRFSRARKWRSIAPARPMS
jgi:short-subunit dehydrogenase